MGDLLFPAINFALFAILLYSLLKKPVKGFVHERHVTLSQTLKEVRQQLKEAREQFEEFSAKLGAVKVEEDSILDAAKKEALESQTRILNYASERSNQIIRDAKESTQRAFVELKAELKKEFADQVVAQAEQLIKKRLTGEDQQRIRKRFSSEVGESK